MKMRVMCVLGMLAALSLSYAVDAQEAVAPVAPEVQSSVPAVQPPVPEAQPVVIPPKVRVESLGGVKLGEIGKKSDRPEIRLARPFRLCKIARRFYTEKDRVLYRIELRSEPQKQLTMEAAMQELSDMKDVVAKRFGIAFGAYEGRFVSFDGRTELFDSNPLALQRFDVYLEQVQVPKKGVLKSQWNNAPEDLVDEAFVFVVSIEDTGLFSSDGTRSAIQKGKRSSVGLKKDDGADAL